MADIGNDIDVSGGVDVRSRELAADEDAMLQNSQARYGSCGVAIFHVKIVHATDHSSPGLEAQEQLQPSIELIPRRTLTYLNWPNFRKVVNSCHSIKLDHL